MKKFKLEKEILRILGEKDVLQGMDIKKMDLSPDKGHLMVPLKRKLRKPANTDKDGYRKGVLHLYPKSDVRIIVFGLYDNKPQTIDMKNGMKNLESFLDYAFREYPGDNGHDPDPDNALLFVVTS